MDKSPTMIDLHNEKRELEREILNLVSKFEHKFSINITSISLGSSQAMGQCRLTNQVKCYIEL